MSKPLHAVLATAFAPPAGLPVPAHAGTGASPLAPARDSVDQLRAYLSWTPGVTGAAGSRPEVDKAIAAFRIHARKVPLSDGGYTMDHTPFVMLFDRNGHFVQTIAYREAEGTAVEKLRALIGTS